MRIVMTVLAVLVLAGCRQAPRMQPTNLEHSDMSFWRDAKFEPDTSDPTGKRGRWSGWFRQENVDASRLAAGVIRARVEGSWREFRVVELPQGFREWNFGRRLEQLAVIKQLVADPKTKLKPEIAGPHNAIVASHGLRRKDSEFTINNAVKGTGWLPRPEHLPAMIGRLRETWDAPMPAKLARLESLYSQETELLDFTKQASLELYSTPGFETHTFLNQMTDPGVAVVFLDLPKSYELRCIAQMLHPADPGLTEYERQVVEYVNLIHDYFHGKSPRQSIAVIYHVIQVFDNSPGKMRGQRVVPPLP